MQYYEPFLQWIDHQKERMYALVENWSNINTSSKNIQGLSQQLEVLKESFKELSGNIQELCLPQSKSVDAYGNLITEPLGKALFITKRHEAKTSVFLSGHMDTVFPVDSPFQKAVKVNHNKLIGPGVADMKGGLVILLFALLAFEKSPFASQIGWEVLITPDEEIGSPGSKSIFERAAKRNAFGLIFEPSFPDGSLVSDRGGSMNMVVVVKGKAAHAGRNYHQGKSALFAIAPFISELEQLNQNNSKSPCIVNVGHLQSGYGFNIVPDLAICKINLRTDLPDIMKTTKHKIYHLAEKIAAREGITIELHEITERPPKIFDTQTDELFTHLATCAEHLGTPLKKKPSRGVTDGNILAANGLVNIDTLGAIGGELHTTAEYILLDSLVQRAKLCALFLMKFANGEWTVSEQKPPIAL